MAQVDRKNPGFKERRATANVPVNGYSTEMSASTSYESDWDIKFTGTLTKNQHFKTRVVTTTLSEFQSLGDPIIIGLPFMDEHGGLEYDLRNVTLPMKALLKSIYMLSATCIAK